MNYEATQVVISELITEAKLERANGGSKAMIKLIHAQIEIHKESAIRNPAKAEEFRGSVIALRQLLNVTDQLIDEDE